MFLSHVLYHIVSSFDLRKILPHGMYHSVTCFLISEEEFSVFWIISTLVAVMNLTAVCVHLYAHVGFYTTTIPGMIVTLDHSFMCVITNMGKKHLTRCCIMLCRSFSLLSRSFVHFTKYENLSRQKHTKFRFVFVEVCSCIGLY